MTAAEHPIDLASAARDLVAVDDERTSGLWPRAAALLARQSLEESLRLLWGVRAPGLQYTSWKCQLLCLPSLLGDDELAGRASNAWWALSRVLHHDPYELPPAATELNGWIETVWELGNRVERIVGRAKAAEGST